MLKGKKFVFVIDETIESLTPIGRHYFCSRYEEVRAAWQTLTRVATPSEQYCIALAAFFGGVDGMDHSNEFAVSLLMTSAERGYLPAAAALRVNFDWLLAQRYPDKLSLTDASVVSRLLASDSHRNLEAAYWMAKIYELGDGVRKNEKVASTNKWGQTLMSLG